MYLLLSILPIIFLSASPVNSNELYNCYATPNSYGDICVATGPAVPHPGGLTIGYAIDVVGEVDTEVCCKVRGWDGLRVVWVELLCDRKSIKGVAPWANSEDHKAIRCKGDPLGANVNWS